MPRKLIEVIMPVKKINSEVEREKVARKGLPSNVHIWWTRTPMAVSRSALFASIIDDPSEHPDQFSTKEDQDKERDRLLGITEKLAELESAANETVLQEAKNEIENSSYGQQPTAYDPFAGGGSTPVEAHRLGLKCVASDVNAVASLITTVVSDIPGRFVGTAPVHPSEAVTNSIGASGVSSFAEDVCYYGESLLQEAYRKIGHLYPKVKNPEDGKELEVSAWIWARTIKCPNPTCDCTIPLSYSYDLSKKEGAEAWVEPVIEGGNIRYMIRREPQSKTMARPKVAQTAVFKCPTCGDITTDAYVKEYGRANRFGSQLIAIVADNKKRRLYLDPTYEHINAAKTERPKSIIPGELPEHTSVILPTSFGLCEYSDLFTSRQMIFIATMMDMAKELQDEIEKAAIEHGFVDDRTAFHDGGKGALAYAEAIRMTLVLTVSKLLDSCSNLCSWRSYNMGVLRNVFSRAAMPMVWDYAEANPFAQAGGSWASALSRTCEALRALPVGVEGRTFMADAAKSIGIHDAFISTDLPYYDRAAYQELSDFFYVWLKYGLGDLYPEYFRGDVSSKEADMTAFSYRYGGDKQKADAAYYEKMQAVFRNLYTCATNEYPSTIGYLYKRKSASNQEELSEWERFVSAVCDAGFTITASWPLGRKNDKSIEASESSGIPITLVIRKKEPDGRQITRRQFVAAVKREIPSLLEDLSHIVDKMDLRPSVIGRALNIYTRNQRVIDADGSRMKPHMASRIIEQEIDTRIAEYYINNDTVSEEETYHGRES